MSQDRSRWVTHEWGSVIVSDSLLKSTLSKYKGRVEEVGRKGSRDYSDIVVSVEIRAVDTAAIGVFKRWIEERQWVVYEIHKFKPISADKFDERLARFSATRLKSGSKVMGEVNRQKFIHSFQVHVPSEKVAKAIARALGGKHRKPAW